MKDFEVIHDNGLIIAVRVDGEDLPLRERGKATAHMRRAFVSLAKERGWPTAAILSVLHALDAGCNPGLDGRVEHWKTVPELVRATFEVRDGS